MPFLICGVVIAIILTCCLKSPRGKGWLGEMRVKVLIGRTKPGKKYVINNLMLKVSEGKTSQIDHVVINPRGVFVIETKNYSGRIYGSENQLEWTQVLSYGRVKHKLYNPIKQNRTHIFHISQILSDHTSVPLISAIVFVQGNIHFISAPGVYNLKGLKHTISFGPSVLTSDQMEKIYNRLISAKGKTIGTREHIQNINVAKNNIENNICPRCGKMLVLRKGKNGEFYGCSGYPSCKFTKHK